MQVFQRRQNGSQDFNQLRDPYENGFGDLCGEFWWGLKWIEELVGSNYWNLRIDVEDYDGGTEWTVYDQFKLTGADHTLDLGDANVNGGAGKVAAYL